MYGKKVIKRDIYQIIIPMILENILQISANLVITAMVGRLLANDISAQGICIRITDTLWHRFFLDFFQRIPRSSFWQRGI